MAEKKNARYPVDEWIRGLQPEQINQVLSAIRGRALALTQESDTSLRTTCTICQRTDDAAKRVLSIDPTHPGRRWYCHDCKEGGNFMKLLARELGEKEVKGKAFLRIADRFQQALQGTVEDGDSQSTPASPVPTVTKLENIPLAKSDKERARALINLQDKFTTDTASMPEAVGKRGRRLPDLEALCAELHMGYLSKDSGGKDRTGGLLRAMWCFAYFNADGEKLCFFGWDHDYRQKHDKWQIEHESWRKLRDRAAEQGRQFTPEEPREPMEYRFVKGFHYGIELYGQHVLAQPSSKMQERLAVYGLILTRHPFDAAALLQQDIPAVATCSAVLTREQAMKASRLSRANGGCGIVNLLHDCTPEGEGNVRQSIGIMAQAGAVRLPVMQGTHGGIYQQLRVQDLVGDRWRKIEDGLQNGIEPWLVA